MSIRRARRLGPLTILVALMALAAGCAADDATEASSPPTLDRDVPGLLPAEEAVAEPVATTPAIAAVPAQTAAVLPTPEPPSLLRCLTTRARVAQLLLPLATQPELAGAQVFASSGDLGGIGLLGSPDSGLAAELEALQLASFVPVMVASDEEGGSVQRLADLLGPLPSAASDAQSKSPEDVRLQWVEYGSRVRSLGIDVIFGPVLDVGSGPGISSRSFSGDAATVTAYGRAVAGGLLEAGVTPVFKHFPGHGRATADSHLELPTTPSLAELRTSDLVPYVDLLSDPAFSNSAAVMIGHLSVPGLSDETPTSLSPETINGLLRGEFGFGGLVFTDALNMRAIVDGYGRLEALELAFFAGADIVILGSLADLTPALDHLSQRADDDPEFAAILDNRTERVLAAKGQLDLCVGAQ